MPRAASPCGVCIDENVTQLMHLPDRHFPALRAEPRFIEVLLIPFRVHGRPVGTVWIVSHTDERKFDREDERVVRTLAQFASAGWQLWNALEAAEEANHRKDEFVAMVGHELRNPLAAICNAVHILQEVDTAGHATAVQVVARQSLHLARVAHDLLDLSRIGRGKLELQTGPVELQTAVAAAVETAQAQIGRRGQTLSVELPGAPMWLMGDAVRLAQLLSNLLDNAAKYTPAGGQIWVSARSTEAFPRTSWATSLTCSPSWTPRPAALDWDWRWCGTWRRGMEGASRLRARGPAWAASSRYDCRAYRLRPRPRRRRFSRRRGYRILDASSSSKIIQMSPRVWP